MLYKTLTYLYSLFLDYEDESLYLWQSSCLPCISLCFHLKHWKCISLKLQFMPSQLCSSSQTKNIFASVILISVFGHAQICYPSVCVQHKVSLNVFATVIFRNCDTEVRLSEWWPGQRHCKIVMSGISISAPCALLCIKWDRMFMQPFSWTLIQMLVWNLMPSIIVVYLNVTEASLPSVVTVSVTVQHSFHSVTCLWFQVKHKNVCCIKIDPHLIWLP
jgi:hypothetical protein